MKKIDFMINIPSAKKKGCLMTPKEAREFAKKNNLIFFPEKKSRSPRNSDWFLNRLNSEIKTDDDIFKCILYALCYYGADTNGNRKGYANYEKIICNQSSINTELVKNVLIDWGMNSRGAKLATDTDLEQQIKNLYATFGNLCGNMQLLDFLVPKSPLMQNVCNIFNSLHLSQSKDQLVTVSKTLHFLCPQTFIPIDGKYVVGFFTNYHGNVINDQLNVFVNVHIALATLYNSHQNLFNTLASITGFPVTKLLDFMLIGYYMFREDYIQNFKL